VRNGFAEIIQESSPDIGSIVYRRNAVGAVTEMIDAKGESTTYTYDNAGRLTAKHFVTAPLQDVAYTYDDSSASNFGKGKLTHLSDASGSTALTWTRRGDLASLSSAIGSQTYTTSFSYDLGGRISTITYPSGREVSFTRDAQGQVTAVATRADAAAASSAVLQSIAWQPYGPFSVATLSSGLTLDHGFSLDQELTSITLFDGATSLLHRTFSRSDLINITGIDDPVNAGDQTFAYTPSNRLSIATGEWGSESYSYDPAGNRLSLEKIVNGTATTMSYAYSPLTNRLSSVSLNGEPNRTFTHDAAGNIIEDVRGGHVYGYSYDAAGHLASVTKDGLVWASYLYNSFDQLASRELTAATATPATSHYLYDAQGHLIAEADGSSGAILREYIWLDDMPIAVIDTVADGAPLYHVITDHLYRPIAMYDSTGTQVWSAVWEPFGALLSVSGALALDARFPGQWYQLETGLHYNWHRHYDPTLGRYTQPDPLGLEAGANRFTYALGNPIMNIDPDGQFAFAIPFAFPIFEAFAGISIGVIAGAMIDGALDRPQKPPLSTSYPASEICINALRPGGGKGKDWEKRKDECYEQCKHLMGIGHGNEYRGCFRRCMGSL
jgi:RHS repeat-associated protein